MARDVHWPKIAAEGIAIVVSILLAFAIQAWWEGSQDSAQRDAILQGLASDFAASDADLRAGSRLDSVRLDASQRLMLVSRERRAAPELAATVDTLLTNLFWSGDFEPAVGTLDALLSSGTLEVLDNPELASELTSWLALTEELRGKQAQADAFITEDLSPFLRARGVPIADLHWTDVAIYDLPWEPRRTEAYRMLGDTELESILADLWFVTSDVIGNADRVREQMERIRMILDDELVGR